MTSQFTNGFVTKVLEDKEWCQFRKVEFLSERTGLNVDLCLLSPELKIKLVEEAVKVKRSIRWVVREALWKQFIDEGKKDV